MGGSECYDEKCRQDNLRLLRDVTSYMHMRGIEYWLDFGGLLGLVREGDMIVGDDDLDICATMAEYDKVFKLFDEMNEDSDNEYVVRQSTKYRVCGDITGKALVLFQVRPRSSDNEALLDLFFFQEEHDGVLRSMWTHEDDTFVDTIFPLQRVYNEKWGFDINIPNKPTDRLVEKYGERFMTPSSYKSSTVGKLLRSTNVFSRCMRNKYGKSSVLAILIISITLVYISLIR